MKTPFGRPLEAWPPDQPAKLQSKATDLHEPSRKGRSRMVDLDCNLSRSVPEFFLLLLLRGEKPDECEERRWMESACAQRRQLASAPPVLLASNPSAHPPTRASMRRPTPFTARMGPWPLGRAGAIHGLGCPSIHLALRGPDACTGDGGPLLGPVQGPPRVHGAHGVQAIQSQVPNPPAGVSLVDIARAVGGEKLLISCPVPKPRKKKNLPGTPKTRT